MSKLKELLTKREEVFDDFTAALLVELSEAVSAAGEVIGPESASHVVWSNIMTRSVATPSDTLILSGLITFELGEVVTSEDGDEVVVTEDLLSVINREVRVGMPMTMAENGTRQEIVEYLTSFGKQDGNTAPVDNAHNTHEAENTNHHTVADLAGEFRSAGLTQEQITSMLMFAPQSTGKIN